jgi:outer membrane protein assembly factor BamB
MHKLLSVAVGAVVLLSVGGFAKTPAGPGSAIQSSDWPHWRGPMATGVSAETGLPTRWSETENVHWKAPVGGLGVSTPIVVGGRVVVTSQVGAGERRAGNHPRLVQSGDAAAAGERALGAGAAAAAADGGTTFVVEAFRQTDGVRAWQFRLPSDGPLTAVHDKHNMASPSPVSDGERIYAWFGTGQIVALDLDGQLVWQRHLGRENGTFDIQWGHGSSPTVHGGRVYLLCDHTPQSYLLAVDARTGKDVWRADRGAGRMSYSTPFVVSTATGAEVLINSNERLDAYDATSGAHLWFTGDDNRFPIPMAVVHDGIIYASRGYRSGPYMAIRPGGRGDVSASHVVWRVETGAPYVSSIVLSNGLIFMANDAGVITAVDASNGQRVWQERVGGVFSASPVAADGKIYFVGESGETIVVRAARTPEILARNDIGERSVASMAVAGGRIFLRTDAHVFSIGVGQGR